MGKIFENTLEFALEQDKNDPISNYQNQFYFPEINGEKAIYFTGNSLGLQPKTTKSLINQELDDWAKYGVEGHFEAKNPWYSYHELFTESLAKLVGANPKEVVCMNNLTVNLNLLLVSFYHPTKNRYKILCEAGAFPSDQYALEMQARYHGFDPDDALVEIAPRVGEHLIRTEDILSKIEALGDSLATIVMGGVNYYTGQVFNMQQITKAGHKVGAMVGFDLAHGVGNIPLQLHNWGVDFACWCSYKYLNSGPGSVAGVYIHEKHCENPDLPRFAGWWGHNKATRFEMKKGFDPILSAEAWQMSNAPVFSMAAHRAALNIFDEIGMEVLSQKSEKLTGYLEFIINDISKQRGINLEIITPTNSSERGCQLSVIAHGMGRNLFDQLTESGVIVDWREPNVIRMAPVPLYNSFEDVYRFGEKLRNAME